MSQKWFLYSKMIKLNIYFNDFQNIPLNQKKPIEKSNIQLELQKRDDFLIEFNKRNIQTQEQLYKQINF